MAPLAAEYGYYDAHHSLIPPWVAGVTIIVLLAVAVALALLGKIED